MSEKQQINTNNSIATITVIKVVATVFVLYIHGANLFGYSNCEVPRYLIPLMALFECAVPAFMSVSGYLLFRKPLRFGENIKKKTWRLAIPFLIWSIFWIVFELLGHIVMPDKFSNILGWGLKDILMGVFGIPFYQSPLYGPLWYVRDLFLLSIIAPLIERIIRKYPSLVFIFAMVLWFAPFNQHLREAVCFFLIGAAISCYKQSEKLVKLLDYRIGLILLALGVFCSVQSSWIMYRASTMPFLGFFIILANALARTGEIGRFCREKVRFTFFVYVIHGKILSIIQILYATKFPSLSAIIIGYFTISSFLFICCLECGILFQHLMPRLFAFCNGETIRAKSRTD